MEIYDLSNLQKFGTRELEMVRDLIDVFLKRKWKNVRDEPDESEELSIKFNTSSGNIFLTDEDFNVWIEEDGYLVQFFSCAECGNEETMQYFMVNDDCYGCLELANQFIEIDRG